MSENVVILTESEIRDALNKYFIPDIYYKDESKYEITLYRKTIDDIIEALVLYSSPARVNRHDTKAVTSCFLIDEANLKFVPHIDFIKEQLVYDIAEKIKDDAIVLRSTNINGPKTYEMGIIFRFKDEKPGMEVVDDYDPDERIGNV